MTVSRPIDRDANAEADAKSAVNRRRRNHRVWLMMAVVAVLLSFLLEVIPDGRVAVRGFEQWPLPHSCYSRSLFDIGCPGCGLTRGFIHLANGRVAASLAVNRMAWIIALATVLQIPYRIAALKSETGRPLGRRWPKAFGWTLVLLLLANWCYNLLPTT